MPAFTQNMFGKLRLKFSWEIKFQKTNMRIKESSIKVNIFTWRISSLHCSICSEINSGFSIITSLNPLFITGKKQRCSLETLFSQTTFSFFWDFAKSVRISSTMVSIHAPAYFSQFTPNIESRPIKNCYIYWATFLASNVHAMNPIEPVKMLKLNLQLVTKDFRATLGIPKKLESLYWSQ